MNSSDKDFSQIRVGAPDRPTLEAKLEKLRQVCAAKLTSFEDVVYRNEEDGGVFALILLSTPKTVIGLAAAVRKSPRTAGSSTCPSPASSAPNSAREMPHPHQEIPPAGQPARVPRSQLVVPLRKSSVNSMASDSSYAESPPSQAGGNLWQQPDIPRSASPSQPKRVTQSQLNLPADALPQHPRASPRVSPRVSPQIMWGLPPADSAEDSFDSVPQTPASACSADETFTPRNDAPKLSSKYSISVQGRGIQNSPERPPGVSPARRRPSVSPARRSARNRAPDSADESTMSPVVSAGSNISNASTVMNDHDCYPPSDGSASGRSRAKGPEDSHRFVRIRGARNSLAGAKSGDATPEPALAERLVPVGLARPASLEDSIPSLGAEELRLRSMMQRDGAQHVQFSADGSPVVYVPQSVAAPAKAEPTPQHRGRYSPSPASFHGQKVRTSAVSSRRSLSPGPRTARSMIAHVGQAGHGSPDPGPDDSVLLAGISGVSVTPPPAPQRAVAGRRPAGVG